MKRFIGFEGVALYPPEMVVGSWSFALPDVILYPDTSDTWSHGIDRYLEQDETLPVWGVPQVLNDGQHVREIAQRGRIGNSDLLRGRAFRVVFFAVEEDVSRVVWRIAEDGAEEFTATITKEACEAENLAGLGGESDVLEILSAGEVFYAQDFLVMLLRFGLLHVGELTADDEFGERLRLDVLHVTFGDLPAVAENDVMRA